MNTLTVAYLKHCQLSGLFVSYTKQELVTLALKSISMNLCQPYWKSRGKVREFDMVWTVVSLLFVTGVKLRGIAV